MLNGKYGKVGRVPISDSRFTIRFQLFTNDFFQKTKKITNQRKN